MKMGSRGLTGISNATDHLPPAYPCSAFHFHFLEVGIKGDIAVFMFQHQQFPPAFFIHCLFYHPVSGGVYGSPFGCCHIDSKVFGFLAGDGMDRVLLVSPGDLFPEFFR